MEHFVESGANFHQRLAMACNVAQDGETVSVETSTQGILARRALDRMGKEGVSVNLTEASAPSAPPPALDSSGE